MPAAESVAVTRSTRSQIFSTERIILSHETSAKGF
jgi:hypothetical protein